MYLLRPTHWFTRAGTSSASGTNRGAGSKSGGGSTGGKAVGSGSTRGSTGGTRVETGSTGGSMGGGGKAPVSPASGKTGTILRSGNSNSVGSASRIVTSYGRIGLSAGGSIWSRPSSTYYGGYRGSSRPIYPGYILLFGFWPIVWLYDYPEGYLPTSNTRPGGPLITAAMTPPNSPSSNTTYIIYGDTQSVEDMLPSLALDCSAVTASTTGFNATATDPIQAYREDSFALMAKGLDQPGRNTTFETCLNDTIADNLLVLYSRGQAEVGAVGAMWTLVVVLCLAMMRA